MQNSSLAGLLYPSASNESPNPSGILKSRNAKKLLTILSFLIALYLKNVRIYGDVFQTEIHLISAGTLRLI
jgi:hypothetical protein